VKAAVFLQRRRKSSHKAVRLMAGVCLPLISAVSVLGLVAVERPNQTELLVFDIGQAIKTGAAGGDFFAGVRVGLNARHAKKALVFGGDVFAKSGVVLLCGFTHQPHVFGGLFIAVLSPCRVQRQGRSQKYPTPICDHFSAHLKIKTEFILCPNKAMADIFFGSTWVEIA
jgi:hypothetical protein